MKCSIVVHVLDDDEGMRESLVALLGAAGYETREYASADQLLASGTMLDPGCIVSDIRMPGTDGLALLKKLRAEACDLPVILITGHGDIPLAVAAMKAGAVDFLEKPFEADALLAAIEAGLHPRAPAKDEAKGCLAPLTCREREVLERLVAGESNKEVALKLGISHRTVEFHRAHIFEKTGARGLPDLVRLWLTCDVTGWTPAASKSS